MQTGQRTLLYLVAVLFLAAAGIASYLYFQLQELRSNPERLAQEETRRLVAKVGEIMVLPEGEEPTAATVTDPEQLRSQAGLQGAKLGDRILIYAQAGRAILYDPVQHKIIDVVPVNIGPPPSAPASAAPASAAPAPAAPAD